MHNVAGYEGGALKGGNGGIDHDVLFISGRVVLVFHNGIRGDYRIMDSSKKIGRLWRRRSSVSKVTLGMEDSDDVSC